MSTPPLPAGFVLDQGQTPPLPEGFVIDGQQPQVMNQEPINKDQAIMQGFGKVKELWNKAGDAIEGNAEFKDAGSFESDMWSQPNFGLTNPDNWKTTLAGMFGTDKDKANSYFKNNPDQKKQVDKNGNVYYLNDKGKITYIDDPGLDAGDLADLAGESSTYAAGGLATAPIKNALLRTGATGLSMTGANVVNQKLAGRENIDKTEAVIAGISGGMFEGAMPMINKVVRTLKNRGANNVQIGQQIAGRLGIKNLSKSQLDDLGKYTSQLDDSIKPETIAQHVELNQTPTRGSLTKDQRILTSEKDLRSAGNKATIEKFRQIDDANRSGLNQALKGSQKRTTGSIDASDKMAQAVQRNERIASGNVERLYDNVGDPSIGKDTLNQLPQRIKKAFSENDIILDPSNIQKTSIALDDLKNSLSKIQSPSVKGVKFKTLEAQRRRIASQFKGGSSEDRRALSIMLKEYDDGVEMAFKNDLLSGDPKALENLQKARKEYQQYASKYRRAGTKDKGGKMIDEWLSIDTPPEHIANGIINANGFVSKDAPHMARRYLDIVGKDTKEHDFLKEVVIGRLIENNAGQKTRASLKTTLSNTLKGQPTFMKEVFNPQELSFLSRTLQFLDSTEVKGIAGRSSGTSERLFRMLNESTSSDTLGSGFINMLKSAGKMLLGQGSGKTLNLPYKQINSPTGRAISADIGTNYYSSSQ